MEKPMKNTIAISGATGFVGKNLTKHFDQNKTKYISITRTALQRKKSLSLPRCFSMVHLVGVGVETVEKSFHEVNIELTKKIVDISKKSKIKKIIYFSGLGVSKNSTSKYFISKFKAEQIIINSGLDYTIFRPSYIIGKDDYLTKNIRRQLRKKKILIPGSGKYVIQPISIHDVCEVILIALKSRNFSKKIIDLVGPEKIMFTRFVKNISSKFNVDIEKISAKQAYLHALNNKQFPYGVEDLNILLGNFQGNYNKLRKLSGIKFTRVEKT
jgi:NADH dehydrogenase